MRSGFVALAGRPNAGKSTLVNSLVGEKVAIVSDKPQTTRSEMQVIQTKMYRSYSRIHLVFISLSIVLRQE